MESEDEDTIFFVFYKSLYEDIYHFIKNQTDNESKILLKKLEKLIVRSHVIIDIVLFNEIKSYFEDRQSNNNASEIYDELIKIELT